MRPILGTHDIPEELIEADRISREEAARILDEVGQQILKDLIRRLELLPKKSKRVFNAKRRCMNVNFIDQRKRTKAICQSKAARNYVHNLRYWKATTEYHRTKDILYVQKLLGHKNLSSTMIYIDVEKAIYRGQSTASSSPELLRP